uniref:Uncharacterized protein n=1 Tax=Amphimedon queenslandica TaxID=400682 RepID=A0A1X7U8X4_AMPQE
MAVQGQGSIKPKLLRSIIGTIVSMEFGLGTITRLHTTSLYALLNSRASWYADLVVSLEAEEELFWHSSLQHFNGQNISHYHSAVRVVFSDASESGLGVYSRAWLPYSPWPVDTSRNVQELCFARAGCCNESA